jgi:glycosyltransferase involved in cell wall biosynthesis
MAFVPYFAISPTFIMSLVGLLYGRDHIIPNPKDNWRDASFDLAIPAHNEEKTIVLCLSSIKRQTIQPREIVLYDDLSTDRTVEFAEQFALEHQMNLRVVKRIEQQGKTLALYELSKYSNADVVGVVDADTLLKSKCYFERLIQELFQGIGRASACGTITSLTEHDREVEYQTSHLESYFKQHPQLQLSPDQTIGHLIQRAISNAYRNELYLFLQHIVYHSEMFFLGTLIFPIGCAVVYRRTYLHDILEHYIQLFGLNISDSEDIFIGFAFARQGYHNVQVPDVSAATMEPRFLKLFKQIFKWSSAYYQCCFYFNSLLNTPFKWPKFLLNKWRSRDAHFKEKRKIKEVYRQPFGTMYTQKYGRHMVYFCNSN